MQLHACSGHLTCATSMYKAIIPGFCTVYRIFCIEKHHTKLNIKTTTACNRFKVTILNCTNNI